MKRKFYAFLLAFGLAIGFGLVTDAQAVMCRWIPGHWRAGVWIPKHRVCSSVHHRVHGCRWIGGRWHMGRWIPRHRVCW